MRLGILKLVSFVIAFGVLTSITLHSHAQDPLDALMRAQNFESRRESSSNPDLAKNGDARAIEAGQELVIGDLAGPGVIAHMWCTVGMDDPFYPRALLLRVYYDGAEKPSVEAPLGDFMGVGNGALANFSSAVSSTSSWGRSMNFWWRMPFRKSARVTITNDSKTRCDSFYYYLDWQKVESLPDDTVYFHARYRQDYPARPGDYTILETTGRGHYVGTVQSVFQMETGWFGEGDDRFYIDGEETPSLRGTGTEDYYGDAWGFRAFSYPYNGVSVWEGYMPGDRVTAYRWHVPDPVPFKKSLKVSIEHHGSIFTDAGMQLGQFIERDDWVSSVAYWYQDPPVQFDGGLPPIELRLPPYRILTPEQLETTAEPQMMLTKNKDEVFYLPRKPDAKLTFNFDVADKGRYWFAAVIIHSVFGGRYQPFLDGAPLGPELDLCISGHDPLMVRFDLRDLDAGRHELRFEGRGASPQQRSTVPPAHAIGLRSIILLRMEDMAGYRAAMQRKQQGN